MDKEEHKRRYGHLCACGCGGTTWGKYVKGHRRNPAVSRETSGVADEGKAAAFEAADAGSTPAPRESGQGQASPAEQGFDSAESVQPDPPVAPNGPPNHPEHLDRRRWRIAADRPGTPLTNPWIKTQCSNCFLPMYTRDQTSTLEKGGMCEECNYVMTTEVLELQGKQWNRQLRAPHDPFRPR